MKRKTLISIALIFIMLLNCIMPLFVVNAADGDGAIYLNSKLYAAVKKSLSDQNISYTANDVKHTLTLSPEEISKVTELNLNEGGIYDLTGLEKFTSLKHLELSGNNLSKDSNLETLNSLPLNYLDLSTNSIEDVSGIDSLIDTINNNNGTVILSGQTVTIVNEAVIDVEEGSNNETVATFTLPPILEKAGFLKSVWITEYAMSEDGSFVYPSIEKKSNPVTKENNFINVRIQSDTGTPYKGLYKLEIYIYDDPTEAASAANLNPAATNILNGSRFYVYVVVHDSDSTAITTPDTNLYKAIKEQLTEGQTVNPNLDSYPYNVNSDGEQLYDECTYSLENNMYYLTILGDTQPTYVIYNNGVYKINYTGTNYTYPRIRVTVDGKSYYACYYNNTFEKTILQTVDSDGVIEYKEGFKVASNGKNETLYIRAYDDPKTFIIDNDVLCNKITNLILNNKEIRDLTGIEKFVGLDSYLNVSHNYLVDIDPIFELQANKDAKEAEIQAKFTRYLNSDQYGSLAEALSKTKQAKNTADAQIKNISEAIKSIKEKLKEATEIKEFITKEVTVTADDGTTSKTTEETKNENYEKDIAAKAKEINDLQKAIYGYDEVDETTNKRTHVDGYLEIMEKNLSDASDQSKRVYGFLSTLYNIYSKDYKLATVLTPELNYLTIEEYENYETLLEGTSDSVKSAYTSELSRLAGYYNQDALSNIEKELIFTTLGISDSEEENPITKYISETVNETQGNRLYWVDEINAIRETALYIEMINYCMINRMEESTASTQCYVEEYLENRIKEFGYEGIDTTLEENILAALKGEKTRLDATYKKFVEFLDSEYVYTNADGETQEVATCKGEYDWFNEIIAENTSYESIEEIANMAGVDATSPQIIAVYNALENKNVIKTISVLETIDYANNYKDNGELNLYKELTALAGKFVANASEVSRYITLPKLKKLDISYNAYLEGIERIPELTGLREFYANACYITDITTVDWSAMPYIRKLGLAYNYIPSIEPLEVLENIEEIDASHNLISGEFKFNFTNCQEKLKLLDLSSNQIEDITSIMRFLDTWSNGNDGNYLAREDTVDIFLHDQKLTLNVKDTIWLDEYPETVDIELPKIFTQLMAIDVERTAFGETSQNGRIESEGKYVTLNTRTVGEKQGVVKVIAMSGNNTPVETCVGEGTTVTINYYVDQRTVTSVKISPEGPVNAEAGQTVQFTAQVDGTNLEDKSVVWTIEGNTSENTTISEEGLLTIGEDEASEEIKVTATSKFDNTKSDSAVVKVVKETAPEGTTITVSPSTAIVKVGNTKAFAATVNGDLEDKSVVWSVEGNSSENTTISEEGVLTVGEDETSEQLTVTATLGIDSSIKTSATVTVAKADEEVPEVTGIKVNGTNSNVKPGENTTFTATVEGENLTDTTVTWSIQGNTSDKTTITKDGVLTIGEDETAETIKVIATSNYDTSKTATVEVTISKADEESGVEVKFGYETEDEYIVGVKPKTPVADFKTALIGDQDYNVVIKKDGSTITSGYMQTGMYVQIQDKDGNVVKNTNGDLVVYEVIVIGDVNGDGYANSLDSLLIKAHRTEVQTLKAEAFEAADINNDGNVNVTDSKLLLYHRAEVTGYDLNYTK